MSYKKTALSFVVFVDVLISKSNRLFYMIFFVTVLIILNYIGIGLGTVVPN